MNAKEEFLQHTKGKEILCATITIGTNYFFDEDDEDERLKANLEVAHSPKEYLEFLSKIDQKYDSGYGGQQLFGTIWYRDGNWSERGEYDGSEWWDYKTCPPIPEKLNNIF